MTSFNYVQLTLCSKGTLRVLISLLQLWVNHHFQTASFELISVWFFFCHLNLSPRTKHSKKCKQVYVDCFPYFIDILLPQNHLNFNIKESWCLVMGEGCVCGLLMPLICPKSNGEGRKWRNCQCSGVISVFQRVCQHWRLPVVKNRSCGMRGRSTIRADCRIWRQLR